MHERKLLSGICAAVFLMFLAGTWGNLRAQEAHLDVTSNPTDAHVSVDGMEMRKLTPLRVDLRLGTHEVKVYIPNSTWSPETRTVNIVRGDWGCWPARIYGCRWPAGTSWASRTRRGDWGRWPARIYGCRWPGWPTGA